MTRADRLVKMWQSSRLAEQDGFLAEIAHATPKMVWWNTELVGSMLATWQKMDVESQDDFLKGVLDDN